MLVFFNDIKCSLLRVLLKEQIMIESVIGKKIESASWICIRCLGKKTKQKISQMVVCHADLPWLKKTLTKTQIQDLLRFFDNSPWQTLGQRGKFPLPNHLPVHEVWLRDAVHFGLIHVTPPKFNIAPEK